jgi:hypothetical protein
VEDRRAVIGVRVPVGAAATALVEAVDVVRVGRRAGGGAASGRVGAVS